jgi:hypothetical protein
MHGGPVARGSRWQAHHPPLRETRKKPDADASLRIAPLQRSVAAALRRPLEPLASACRRTKIACRIQINPKPPALRAAAEAGDCNQVIR